MPLRSRVPQSSSFKTPTKKITRVLLVVAASLFVAAGNGFGQTTIPDTPAGKTLRAWLDAFNSGDRAKVEAYIKAYDPEQSVERMMGFHDQTGGFDLLAIESSEPLRIRFRVKEKASSTVGIGSTCCIRISFSRIGASIACSCSSFFCCSSSGSVESSSVSRARASRVSVR
jgi:hypothetical protein